jgi:hypothetical protein
MKTQIERLRNQDFRYFCAMERGHSLFADDIRGDKVNEAAVSAG